MGQNYIKWASLSKELKPTNVRELNHKETFLMRLIPCLESKQNKSTLTDIFDIQLPVEPKDQVKAAAWQKQNQTVTTNMNF